MASTAITESEWRVMEVLWDRSPMTASEVTQTLKDEKGWADNTVRTLLSRLVDKGALQAMPGETGVRVFMPMIQREAQVQSESRSFLQRVFRGAERKLLVHFASNATLTEAEVKDLKRLLDQSLNVTKK